MQTPWKPIFGYDLSETQNSQKIYDEIFKAALTHKFANSGLSAIPVNGKALTDAIFNLDSHDNITILPGKIVNGQKLKELFITTIFLKFLESKLSYGSLIYIAVPHAESSVDAAVLVAESNTPLVIIDDRTARLPKLHASFEFQIKEYVDHQRLKEARIVIPEPIDVERLTNVAGSYKEIVLVYLRAFVNFNSDDVKEFFEVNPNCYLIHPFSGTLEYTPSGDVGNEPVTIQSKVDKHNFVVVFPSGAFSTIAFDPPSVLVKVENFPYPYGGSKQKI